MHAQRAMASRVHDTLFVTGDEVEAAWSWIDSISEAWRTATMPAQAYPAGSWGPAQAEEFLPVTVPASKRPVKTP